MHFTDSRGRKGREIRRLSNVLVIFLRKQIKGERAYFGSWFGETQFIMMRKTAVGEAYSLAGGARSRTGRSGRGDWRRMWDYKPPGMLPSSLFL